MTGADLHCRLDREGFAVLPSVLNPQQVITLMCDLERALSRRGQSVLHSRGLVYGSRNLIDVWPAALAVAQHEAVRGVVHAVLGAGYGLVRSIYFDKPPGRTWSLPWHRDVTIAVRDATTAPTGFQRATVKAGAPHVEAPSWLLRRMLTVRVALDDVVDENGPLLVIAGSHKDGNLRDLPAKRDLAARAQPVYMRAGDVLFMRPLVVHRSGASRPETVRHRRTLHFEFAAGAALPDPLEWHRFVKMTP